MPTILRRRSNAVPLRRRIQIRVETFARTAAKAVFHFRHNWRNGISAAWEKAKVTL